MATLAHNIDWPRWLFVGGAFVVLLGVGLVALFPVAMLRREAVKRSLLERACEPLRIRWLVFAGWCPDSPLGLLPWVAMPFRVIYSDPSGLIHRAHCWVGLNVYRDSPFSPRRICWLKDEIIGQA